jgi:hypothetical protein
MSPSCRPGCRGAGSTLFLILDLWSRKVAGHEVHETDQAEHAAHLVRRTALAEGIHVRALRPVLHGDNGLYRQARERHPRRWSGRTRDWSPIGAVTLNPERDSVIAAASTVAGSPAVGGRLCLPQTG